MNKDPFIGIDANEANLVQHRLGSNEFAYGLLKTIEKIDTLHSYQTYLSTPLLNDMPKRRPRWNYRIIPPHTFWTQWRLPLDLYLRFPRPKVFLSLSHYVPRFSPIPRIVTITDLGYLKFPEQLRKKDLLQLKLWTAYSIKVADHIIAISEFTKKDILDNYQIDMSKISVIYPGYDKSIFNVSLQKKSAKQVLKKYNIDPPYLLFLGALKPSKNLERLIEAFNQLDQNNLKLVIAGKKGWLYESVFEIVKKLNLENKVIFTDFVSDKDKPLLMSYAEAFLLPSLYEGFGIPVVESMACGVPVLVSNQGSLPEVVDSAGIVVNPYEVQSIADGIKKTIKERERLIKKGLERVKLFDWEASAKKTINLLEQYF
jgi:glycosyltransferase involved in cell wall biosynthesis